MVNRKRVRKTKESLLTRIIINWPLRKYIGVYAFLPFFFCAGAAIEYLMINMNINNVNFYRVYSRRLAEDSAKNWLITQANIEKLIEEEKAKLIEKIKESENKQKKSD